jgi:hypothetical protein
MNGLRGGHHRLLQNEFGALKLIWGGEKSNEEEHPRHNCQHDEDEEQPFSYSPCHLPGNSRQRRSKMDDDK